MYIIQREKKPMQPLAEGCGLHGDQPNVRFAAECAENAENGSGTM
jgi:hypothetical protein